VSRTLPTLSESRRWRLLTVCALYLAQGIPWGFLAITLTAWLADQGKTPADIARIATLGALPWAFKWAWGPLIDAFGVPSMGRRRPWILLAQGLMAATILAMVAIPDLSEQIGLVAWMVFLHNIFNALQDVAVDALAVDLLPEDERGRANGLMYASKYLGGAVGGAGMATVMGFAGLRGALLVQVTLLGAIFLLPLLLLERPGDRFLPWGPAPAGAPDPAPRPSVRGLFVDLARAFTVRSTIVGAALALTINVGMVVLGVVGVVFIIQELGWTDTEFSQATGGPGLIAGAGGAVFGGYLADRVGLRRMIAAASLLLSATWVVFALSPTLWPSKGFVLGIILAESAFSGVASAGLFALFMGISWPRVAATQFTAYMAMLNLSRVIGSNTAAALDPLMSVPTIYLYCAGLTAATLVLLPWIDPAEARRAFARFAARG
jgi:PAT family beta-lactamase induction signal transducer AmpG